MCCRLTVLPIWAPSTIRVTSCRLFPASDSRRNVSGAEPPVDQGHKRQQVFGVFLADGPMDTRLVRGCVSKHAECATDQIGEPPLLTPLALRAQGVNCEHRRVA